MGLSDIPEKYQTVKCPICGMDVTLHSFSHQPVIRLVEINYMCFGEGRCGAVFNIMWEHS